MSIPTGRAFAKALEEAGVISHLNSITRVIIDIQPGDLVRVYVERVGDKQLLDAFSGQLGMMLAENAPEAEPAGVRYWTAITPELIGDTWLSKTFADAGLRIIEPGPWRDTHMRLFLIEDDGAPEDLAGHTVELTFEQVDDSSARVSRRDVIA